MLVPLPEKGTETKWYSPFLHWQSSCERAAAADLELLKRTQQHDKNLLLIELGSENIDSVLRALDNYLDTDDKLFLSLAHDFKKTLDNIVAAL